MSDHTDFKGILWAKLDGRWHRVRMRTVTNARICVHNLTKLTLVATHPNSRLDRIMKNRRDAVFIERR